MQDLNPSAPRKIHPMISSCSRQYYNQITCIHLQIVVLRDRGYELANRVWKERLRWFGPHTIHYDLFLPILSISALKCLFDDFHFWSRLQLNKWSPTLSHGKRSLPARRINEVWVSNSMFNSKFQHYCWVNMQTTNTCEKSTQSSMYFIS